MIVIRPLAVSYISGSAREAGLTAELTTTRKAKTEITGRYTYIFIRSKKPQHDTN